MSESIPTTTPVPAPPPPPKRRLWVTPVAAIACLIVGVVIGVASNTAEADSSARPEPAPTVTVTAPPEIRTVETVPQACLDALDAGEIGFAIAATAFQASSDGMMAALEFDSSGVEQAISDMEDSIDAINAAAPEWNDPKAECRAAAR